MTSEFYQVMYEVREERTRQDARWGEQNHDSVSPLSSRTRKHAEEAAKKRCEAAAKHGVLRWEHIAEEELAEALAAPTDVKRRAELVQLAAVVIAWVECIDRKSSKEKQNA